MYRYSHLYKIMNQHKYKSSNETYYLCRTDKDTFLFTDYNLDLAKERANKNPSDIPARELFCDEIKQPSSALTFVCGLITGISIVSLTFLFMRAL